MIDVEQVRKTFDDNWSKEKIKLNLYEPQNDFLMKNIITTGKILDVGCGMGQYVDFIYSNHNKDIKGIDLSDVPKNDRIVNADYCTHNFEEKFDCIYSLSVLEFIPDTLQVLKKMNSDLNSNGTLIFTVPTWKFNLFNIQRNFIYRWTFGKFCPYHCYSPKQIKNLLNESGFELLEMKGYMCFVMFDLLLLLKVFNKLIKIDNFINNVEKFYYEKIERMIPNKYLQTFGYHLIVKARKK